MTAHFFHVEYRSNTIVTLKWVYIHDDLVAYAERAKADPLNTVIVVGNVHADLVKLAEAITNLPDWVQVEIFDTWMEEGRLWRLPDGELEAFILPRLSPLKGNLEHNFWEVYFPAIAELALKRAVSVSRADIEEIIAGECLKQRDRVR